MVSFVAMDEPDRYRAIVAGAESNVAMDMARLGCRTGWVSRVGDDPFGRRVEEWVTSAGVDVSVLRDPEHPTGLMIKHPAGSEKVSSYYRSDSAARSLRADDLRRAPEARWVHVTGITPALSASAADLVRTVVGGYFAPDTRVSFDVNVRQSLWPDARTASDSLLPLAQGADLVFIGDDEAEYLFGSGSAREIADLILRRGEQTVVVKRGPGDASAITLHRETSVPALPTRAIDVTGAGDAFAAGYLAATCFDWPVVSRLRLGHALASRVVASTDDTLGALTDEELDDMSQEALASTWEAL
jgi:2-dehydro-3-deoxygluconokinase